MAVIILDFLQVSSLLPSVKRLAPPQEPGPVLDPHCKHSVFTLLTCALQLSVFNLSPWFPWAFNKHIW